MLSLKSMPVAAFSNEPKTTIQQLPLEILDDIAQQVLDDGLRRIDTLIPFASTCRRLRESALPLLFRRVSHAVHHHNDDCAGGNLRRLVAHAHLLTSVQTLHITMPFERPSTVPQAHAHAHAVVPLVARQDDLELEPLRKALPMMHLLRCVRFECPADAAYRILLMLPRDRAYEIILDRICPSQTWPDPRLLVAKLPVMVSCHKLSVGMVGDCATADDVTTPLLHQALLRASAVHLPAEWVLGDGIDNTMHSTSPSMFGSDDSLEELFLHTRRCPRYRPIELHVTPSDFPWQRLRRLSLDLGGFLPEFWRYIGPRLTMLEALRIHGPVGSSYSLAHGDARHYTRRLANGNGEYVDGQPHGFDLTNLQNLRELEINGRNFSMPMSKLVGLGLRRLRLHSENVQLYAFQSRDQRSPGEIMEAARRAPDLEHLELDIGYIDNLWHPTAIPGVDVDVEQYSFLDAITRFRRLRFLRLFPPFVARGETFDYNRARLCVPVSDDQAIRLFEHLGKKCPRLQTLSIAAVPYAVRTHTMSWEVKRHGVHTVLTTRHRDKNYQHRQVWVGQRRLSSEIQRFTKRTPYLSESESWTLSDLEWEDRMRVA